MAANFSHSARITAPVAALLDLLTTHPELAPEASGLAWTLTPTGTLHAEVTDAADGGRAVDACARALHATVLRDRAGDGATRSVIARLVAVHQGVPVEVWETYRTPETVEFGGAA